MPWRKLFEAVNKNINKFEVRLENYIIPSLKSVKLIKNYAEEDLAVEETKRESVQKTQEQTVISSTVTKEEPAEKRQELSKIQQSVDKNNEEKPEDKALQKRAEISVRYAVFDEKQETDQPKLCMWYYMSEENVNSLLKLSKRKIRETIDNNMKLEYPKGISRALAIELMYSVVRFCQKCKFNVSQTGTLLSLFYLTHHYFVSSFYTTAEKTYNFFKEYMLLHCFNCPPDSIELFNYKESTHVVQYFCRLYLRNLPLIRLLTLPNFAFHLNYEKQPDSFEEMGKKSKGKRDKGKEKNKKDGKKGKK